MKHIHDDAIKDFMSGFKKTAYPNATPETPEFYLECIKKDVREIFEHAVDMLKKCDPDTNEFNFFKGIIEEYVCYYTDEEMEEDIWGV